MEPKIKNLDYDHCVIRVDFDQCEKMVTVEKLYHVNTPEGMAIRSEKHEFDLRTMPLSVALQMASVLVQQVGLVEYE